MIFAEILHDAGVPAGVFNLVNGEGPVVGEALSSHPDVDLVSFTGSTRAGVQVAHSAAPSVKRVALELGGKVAEHHSARCPDLQTAVQGGVMLMMLNSGQSCNAPSRMFVPRRLNDAAKAVAQATAAAIKVQAPSTADVGAIGPLASKAQFEKVQRLIGVGISEGAALLSGGLGRPAGLSEGFYVKPTVFADCTNQMTVEREEIFGPVLVMITTTSITPSKWPTTPRTASPRTCPVAHATRLAPSPAHPHGERAHRCQRRLPGAFRGLQAVGQRARVGCRGHGRVPRDEGHARRRRLNPGR